MNSKLLYTLTIALIATNGLSAMQKAAVGAGQGAAQTAAGSAGSAGAAHKDLLNDPIVAAILQKKPSELSEESRAKDASDESKGDFKRQAAAQAESKRSEALLDDLKKKGASYLKQIEAAEIPTLPIFISRSGKTEDSKCFYFLSKLKRMIKHDCLAFEAPQEFDNLLRRFLRQEEILVTEIDRIFSYRSLTSNLFADQIVEVEPGKTITIPRLDKAYKLNTTALKALIAMRPMLTKESYQPLEELFQKIFKQLPWDVRESLETEWGYEELTGA